MINLMTKYTYISDRIDMGRNSRHAAKRQRLRTNKIIDKITYNPSKHKQKDRRKLRAALQSRIARPDDEPIDTPFMRFGSFNVKGVDVETGEALKDLLLDKDLDVSYNYSYTYNLHFNCRYLLLVKLSGAQTSLVMQQSSKGIKPGTLNEVVQRKVEGD